MSKTYTVTLAKKYRFWKKGETISMKQSTYDILMEGGYVKMPKVKKDTPKEEGE